MGSLDHDRLGFNYRLSDVACAIGLAQLGHLEQMLADRAAVAGSYREALTGIEGLELPCPDAAGTVRGWFVSWSSCRPASTGTDDRALLELGIQSKPYLPGHPPDGLLPGAPDRHGQFPVCEDVARRSLLPLLSGRADHGARG